MSVLVLHTTEGTSLEGAARWLIQNNIQSHRLADPATRRAQQLLEWSQSGRSLRNERGGVETNRRGGVYQYEIVGKVADIAAGKYSSDWWDWLASDIRTVCSTLDIPLHFPFDFGDLPEITWKTSRYRMSDAEWLEVEGIVGHMHVPENSHYDPGPIDELIRRLDRGRLEYSNMPDGRANEPAGADRVDQAGDVPRNVENQFVYEWQVKAQAAGYYQGQLDGDFGPKSKAAATASLADLAQVRRQLAAQQLELQALEQEAARLAEELEAAGEPVTTLDPEHAMTKEVAERYRTIVGILADDIQAFTE